MPTRAEHPPSSSPLGLTLWVHCNAGGSNLRLSTPTARPLLAATRWSSETNDILAHGAYTNLVENTFSLHEDAIVDLIEKHKVERAFLTGHSLGGGLANVAHLVVRGQLKKAGSPWAKLNGKVAWLSCTFAAPETIVRLYDKKDIPPPPLIVDLDESSSNIVYGCDPVPRPGMLAYIGNFLEIVVRKIREDIEGIVKKHPKLGFLKLLQLLVLPNLLEDGAVKNLKETGIAGIVNNLTHVGTVVYQKSEYGSGEDKKYMYLTPEAKIRSVLDVKDKKEFRELWGIKAFGKTTQPLVHTLLEAHLHVYKFKFGPQP
jgi:hypothetical protein